MPSAATPPDMTAYAKLHQDALDLTAEIARLEAEKAVTEASDAWNA